ncbi:hypothetical protein F4677DRAFT_442348 [Hypoxylon crocopeplum]|nr:hypothetical protein F4677DRAFT_442348 [Hypoxylon crocopeplum]
MEPYIRPANTQQQQCQEKAAQMNSIISEIRTLYDADTPIFTKDVIRKVGDELDVFQKGALKEGREITLKGINGADYKLFIAPPKQHKSVNTQHHGGSTWMISYHSIESLTAHRDIQYFNLQTAYLPMEIFACTREIDYGPEYEEKSPVSSTEDLSRAFQDAERQWKSEHQRRLQVGLATLETPFILDKVVALALGPLILGTQIYDEGMIQHALVSDPVYTQQEKDVLSLEGFTILDDPQAFLLLDESSILVSINPDIPVKQIVADLCRPGIIIWDKGNANSHLCADPTSSRVADMIEKEYHEMDFPYQHKVFDIVMYIKRSA